MKLKPTILAFFLILNFELIAQNPKTEFSIEFSEKTLELRPGETKDIEIKLLRGKGYQKAKAKFGLSSSLPDGITLTYSPAEGLIHETKATIAIAGNATDGSHVLVLNCTLNNKMKGRMLTVVISGNSSADSTKDH